MPPPVASNSPAPPQPLPGLYWHVDTLRAREATVFVSGYLFHESCAITTLSLVFGFGQGTPSVIIPAEIGKPSETVASEFPQLDNATHAGFLAMGSCARDVMGARTITLCGDAAGGGPFAIDIPVERLRSALLAESAASPAFFPASVTAALRRTWQARGYGTLASLARRVRRVIRPDTPPGGSDPAAILESLAPSEKSRVVLMIDHEIGGGANQFRQTRAAAEVASGATVLVFSFQVPALRYRLRVQNRRIDAQHEVAGPAFLLDLAQLLPLRDIVYNNAVTFPEPERVPDWLVALQQISGARLTLMLHDFYPLCPSPFLLNDAGEFCDLPALTRCQTCLRNTRQDFTAQFPARDIADWRRRWRAAIDAAHCISMASTATLALFNRAYPGVDPARIELLPYPLQHIDFKPIRPRLTAQLCIGVTGHIGYHKGAKVIHALAGAIKRRGLAIHIAVIGVLDGRHDPDVITCTGRYQPAELPVLIDRTGANVFLFPSIVSETFAYVIHELMALGMPVACFNRGAPALQLREYGKGLVLDYVQSDALLDALIAFHLKMYNQSPRALADAASAGLSASGEKL